MYGIPVEVEAFDIESNLVGSNGLFQKISTPPPWTTLNWVPKNFRISKNDNCSLCRIPEPADSKS